MEIPDCPHSDHSEAQKDESDPHTFIDGDGVHLHVIGWHIPEGKRIRYLITCTRPSIEGVSTNFLVEDLYMPLFWPMNFQLSDILDIGDPGNQGGQRICLGDVTCVLDIAWCSLYERECSSKCLGSYICQDDEGQFKEIFILVEWNDKGVSRRTWELAETLMGLLGPQQCVYLLKRWAELVERRQNYLADNVPPPEEVSHALWNPNM